MWMDFTVVLQKFCLYCAQYFLIHVCEAYQSLWISGSGTPRVSGEMNFKPLLRVLKYCMFFICSQKPLISYELQSLPNMEDRVLHVHMYVRWQSEIHFWLLFITDECILNPTQNNKLGSSLFRDSLLDSGYCTFMSYEFYPAKNFTSLV